MVFRNEKGEVIKVWPYGSEAQQSWEKGINILYELCKQYQERKLEKEKILESQIDEDDKKIFRRYIKRADRKYNLTQTVGILGVHRQPLYYWIKKGWLKPRRDYRNYPVFAVLPR